MSIDDLPKSLFAMLASMVLEFIATRIVKVPIKIEEEFNEELITEDQERIKDG